MVSLSITVVRRQQGPFKEREPYGAPLVDMFSPQGFSERETNRNTGLVTLKRS